METSGKVFIGDYIGSFTPGNLILVGPNLPHNWITENCSEEVKVRDLVINFTHDLIEKWTSDFPELRPMSSFWEKAAHGIEFYCEQTSDKVGNLMHKLSNASKLGRLGGFLSILELLFSCQQTRTLSSRFYNANTDQRILDRLNVSVN